MKQVVSSNLNHLIQMINLGKREKEKVRQDKSKKIKDKRKMR